jgi:acyl-coenzyme A synthetase/AMP-(fatty) acid ligase
MLSHRNATSFIDWCSETFADTAADRCSSHAPFHFDLSILDIYLALGHGATLVLIGEEAGKEPMRLARLIAERRLSVWYSAPSILTFLVQFGGLDRLDLSALRLVLFAGEVFPVKYLRALQELLPAPRYFNLYGPTETNVCTYHRVRPADLHRTEPVPIGRPVTGARVSVVDEDGRVLDGPDAFGELIVEGDCVTPGYWRRESEPAAEDHWRHRHATGDLVSYEGDELVYRGRKDRMVKVSGYRIELGEIEAAVLRHPDIADAAVVLDTAGADRRIALYYTLRTPGRGPGLVALKRHCARFLPRYMLPRTATRLDELPRNANGKTDYRRLSGTAGAARPARALPGR